eukprot:497069-Prymnesium_polylepis.1
MIASVRSMGNLLPQFTIQLCVPNGTCRTCEVRKARTTSARPSLSKSEALAGSMTVWCSAQAAGTVPCPSRFRS